MCVFMRGWVLLHSPSDRRDERLLSLTERAVGVQKHAKNTHASAFHYTYIYIDIFICVCVCILNTVMSRVSGNASEDLYTLALLLANALCCFIDVCVYICAYANMYVCVCVCIYSSCNPFCCFCRHTPTYYQ